MGDERELFKDYVRDLGVLIREMSLTAKHEADQKGSDFSMGYLAGFHRIVSLMQQQADAFGIALGEIGLDGIDADIHLT